MPEPARVSATAVEAAFRAVKRACYAGHDSLALRTEILYRSRPVLPCDAFALGVTDPDTGLLTHALGEGISESGIGVFLTHVYPHGEALRFLDLLRDADCVAALEIGAAARPGPFHSESFAEWMHGEGMRSELRASFGAGGDLWGTACLMRETGRAGYSGLERDFLRRIAPHVAHGLRAAALLETAGAEAQDDGHERGAPGVLVIDPRGKVVLRNPAAAQRLADLDISGSLTDGRLPAAVTMLVGRLRSRHQEAAAASDASPLDVEVRTRGRSGCWYRIRASLCEPGPDGEVNALVMVESLRRAELAPLLARLYGLTPREREVVALVARGESTRKIARRLGVSPYTVQDHVGHACEKIGVRGRKRLVARLFLDSLTGGPPQAAAPPPRA